MTVLFDLLGAQNRDHGERGIARLISQLATALERSHPDLVDRYVVHPHLPIPASIEPLVAGGKVVRSDRLELSPSTGGVYIAGSVIELEEPISRILPPPVRGGAWHKLAILYDLIPLKFSAEYLDDPALRSRYLDRVAAYSMFDRLLPISMTSLSDAVELIEFPADRQDVIYAGADNRFAPATPDVTHPAVEGLEENYILFPTGMDWRKNVDRMLEAYASLSPAVRRRHQLVLACRLDPWMHTALLEQATGLGIEEGRLVLPGYLNDEDLVRLNQRALVAVFPSLYEGFGLPALEAMQCGVPVLCADNSSLREVQPVDAARFDGESTAAIGAVLERALSDEAFRNDVLSQQTVAFSWERSADLLETAVARLAPQPARPRLAVVSPLPPQASGIAAYSARLVPELAKYVDLTVFTAVNDEEGEPEFTAPGGCAIRPIEDLEDLQLGAQPFDQVLYMMGNSRFHIKALAALEKFGGAVIFHDARFVSLYNELYRVDPAGLGADFVGAALDDFYPQRYRPSVVALHQIDAETASRFGILMARRIAELATDRLCHSDYAATLLELDTGQSFEHLFDLPTVPPSAPAVRSAKTVAAFGIVDPAKAPDLLIDACGLVAIDDLTLRFVGECEPGLAESLQQRAERLGVRMEITGFVDAERFESEQRSATVAVQLRSHSNGESSGALAELLAHGTPIVASRIGAFGELPDEAIEWVEPNCSAPAIAGALTQVLNEPHQQLRMAEAGRRYAEGASYSGAAQAIMTRLGL